MVEADLGANGTASGRHHRVRPMWHMDTCSSCGTIRRGGYDGYRGDVVNRRTSRYLTARRAPGTGTIGPARLDVNSLLLLAGIVLLVLGPSVGWLVLS